MISFHLYGLWIYAALAGGFVLLALGAEFLVRGAVGVARRLHVSPLLIGVTVVAWGVSAPEMAVSLNAALAGSAGLALGNVVGGTVFNVLFILGAAALVRPIACNPRAIRRDVVMALGAALLFVVFAHLSSVIDEWQAGLFLAVLFCFTVFTYFSERRAATASGDLHTREAAQIMAVPGSFVVAALLVAVGLALLVQGASFAVDGALVLARGSGWSESFVGLTIIAAGTALPELATALVAAARRQGDVAFGTLVGGSIFNILGILGVVGLVAPVAIPADIITRDMWVMLGGAGLLFLPLFTGLRLGRAHGFVLLAGYGAYAAWLYHIQASNIMPLIPEFVG